MLVLDSGGLSSLTEQRARLQELQRRGWWPARVPSVVLAEALAGDHRRDFHVNRLLRACQVRDVDEIQAREAARLRTATGRSGTISAVDAVVAAVAGARPGGLILTSDPGDLRALGEHTAYPVTVTAV